MKKWNRSMTEGPLLPNIILYTIPIILTTILQLLFNAADLVVVGNYSGSVSLAAVGATGAITNLILNMFIGLSVGAGVAAAQGLGAEEAEEVHRTVHTAIPASVISGLILTVVGVFFAEPLLQLMGTPETVLPLSTVYMKIIFGGVTFSMVYNFGAAILRAAGDTKSPLIFLTIAGVINVVLNLIFVIVFRMGVAGVALATIISQAFSAVMVILVLMGRHDACRLDLRRLRIYKAPLLKMIRIGLPAGIQGSLFSISNVIIQSSVNSFGDVFMSGNAAAGNIEGFVTTVTVGFYQAVTNFVGQNVGAKRYDRVKRSLLICMGCAASAALVLGSGALLLGEPLLSIYITDSAEAIGYGMIRMTTMCLTYWICGMMDVTTGALRGMGASTVPMIISVLGVCGIRLGWIFTVFQIPQFHTPQCLYASYPITWTMTLAMQLAAFFIIYRKRMRENTGLTALR